GQLGFIGCRPLRPELWLDSRIPDWLTPFLEGSS
ncbi:UNVERIFIED_CONTAM: hydrolase, partial [Salmonella enterica subsp. enterica serovar Enteritidis]